MPQLIKGHARFTDEDFLYSDFNARIIEYTMNKEKDSSVGTILDIIHINHEYLRNNRQQSNVPHLLSATLEYFLILARKYDLSLEDLIKTSLTKE